MKRARAVCSKGSLTPADASRRLSRSCSAMLPIILALMALAASFVRSTSPGWAKLLEQPVKLLRGVVGTDGLRVLSVERGVPAALGGAKAAGGGGDGYGSKNGAGDAKLTDGRPQPSTAWPYTPYGHPS